MRTTILFLTGMLCNYSIFSQAPQLCPSDPIQINASSTLCVDPTVPGSTSTITILNASTTQKGAASFTASDFDASAGNISIDYANGQAATASVNGFVTTSNQTWAANKTFNGKVLLSAGSESAPSLAYSGHSAANGFSFNNSKIFMSFDNTYHFVFTDGGAFGTTNVPGTLLTKLDVNVLHDADLDSPVQDGGYSVSTYGGTGFHTSTFGGRTSGGTTNGGGSPTKLTATHAMSEFIGKGYCECGADGWEPSNRGVFGVYAAADQTSTSQGAYCAIQTTKINHYGPGITDHFSFVVDATGNAGLTWLTAGAYGTSLPTGWDSNDYSKFFSIESTELTKDVGILLQNGDSVNTTGHGTKGLNIWYDNSANTTYFDNIRSDGTPLMITRLQTLGSPITSIVSNLNGTAFGGYVPGTSESLAVGTSGTAKWVINSSGVLTTYNGAGPSNGYIPIGNTGGWTMGAITATNGTKVTNSAGAIALETDINSLSTDATPDRSSDYVMTYDASAGTNKKVLLSNASNDPGAIIGGTGNQNVSGGATAYGFIFSTSSFSLTEADRQFVMPYAGKISNLYVVTTTNQSTTPGDYFDIYINIDGSASGITIHVAESSVAQTFSETSTVVSFTAGQKISFKVVNHGPSTATAKIGSWSIKITQ